MLEKIRDIKRRYDVLTEELASQEVHRDPSKLRAKAKERSDLEKIVEKGEALESVLRRLEESRAIVEEGSDAELVSIAREELPELEGEREALERELERLLAPKDPDDDRNVILEVRSGTGGEEAALFAAELARMYQRYAERVAWKIEVLSTSPSAAGGLREVIFLVQGRGAYGALKHERGVHRVQRVPVTESGGRIHTSAVTVAVLPEADEVDVELNPADLKLEVFRSSGPGGQSVNTTDSAVRVTHLPSGLVVSCQDEKSQHKNKAKALKVLRARLLERARDEQRRQESETRKTQVGTGDRSEKIRTYNFPQNRVTDHRLNLTLHKLDAILEGDLESILSALRAHELETRIAAG